MSTPAAPTDIHHLEGMTDMTVIDDTIATPAPTAAGAAYRLTSVTKTYRQKGREVKALTGVDLQIEAGEFATIQGPTGGGKSTLLQMLGALDVPTSGTVLLGDTDLAAGSATDLQKVRAHEIGFVFQAFNLIPTLTAAENVAMGLEPLRLDGADRHTRVEEALAHVGLSDRGSHRPGSSPAGSSSGWRSRGPSPSARACCWRMSRRGIWMSRCATRSLWCSNVSPPRG